MLKKKILFQTFQFSIIAQFSSNCPIDMTLSGATTPGQSGHRISDSEEVLYIQRSSSITEASPSDCLVSYQGYPLRRFYSSVEMQSEYSIRLGKIGPYAKKKCLKKQLHKNVNIDIL